MRAGRLRRVLLVAGDAGSGRRGRGLGVAGPTGFMEPSQEESAVPVLDQ